MAVARVFNTYELAEAILLHLPLDTLVLSTRQIPACFAVVQTSHRVRDYILAALSPTCTNLATRAAFDESFLHADCRSRESNCVPLSCGYLLTARRDDEEAVLLVPTKHGPRYAVELSGLKRRVDGVCSECNIWKICWFDRHGQEVLAMDFDLTVSDPYHLLGC